MSKAKPVTGLAVFNVCLSYDRDDRAHVAVTPNREDETPVATRYDVWRDDDGELVLSVTLRALDEEHAEWFVRRLGRKLQKYGFFVEGHSSTVKA